MATGGAEGFEEIERVVVLLGRAQKARHQMGEVMGKLLIAPKENED